MMSTTLRQALKHVRVRFCRTSSSTSSGLYTSSLTSHYKNPQNLIKIPYVKPNESTYKVCSNKDRYDAIVMGGGIMGCSVAFWMAAHSDLKILVIERDPRYTHASTTMSVGGLRQQFSLPENVQMSLFGMEFLANINQIFSNVPVPDIQFQPYGYLFLASDEGVDHLVQNHHVQIECGAKVELMTAKQLQGKFPWLSTEGVAMGSYGYENEGWFDPWALLSAFKLKCKDLNVDFIEGEVHNVITNGNKIEEVHVHLPNGDVSAFPAEWFVIAGGPESGHLAHLAGLDKSQGRQPLPVEPRKRYVYHIHCPQGPGMDCPLVVDPNGTYFRREGLGNHYLCGRSPDTESEEPDLTHPDVDYKFFEDKIWPVLAHRAKSFESIKVKSAWSGLYDYNTWDQNIIVGTHPDFGKNLSFAAGASGHGIQQAPAIGRAVMEMLLDDKFHSIDLSRFTFDRILKGEKILERNIV